MRRGAIVAIMTTVMAAATAVPAYAGKYRVLYSFRGGSDGQAPYGTLIEAGGVLYGTTFNGGNGNCNPSPGCGTVFALDPKTGHEHVVYTFQNTNDGAFPYGGVIDVGGMLYGTTYVGGNGGAGEGTVFAINPKTGAKTVLYTLPGGAGGVEPVSSLTDVGGTLYGTTFFGGTSGNNLCGSVGCGVIFGVDLKSGAGRTVHAFTGKDGAYSFSTLLLAGGLLYGTAGNGGFTGAACGNSGCGTIYALNPASGRVKTLYKFKNGMDGSTPFAGLSGSAGELYGTTMYGGTGCNSSGGCGTVFAFDRKTGTERVVHALAGGAEGAFLYTGATPLGGTLYTAAGNGGNGKGTLIAVNSKTGAATVLHTFGATNDGTYPQASLVAAGGTLYGTTDAGGTGTCATGCGTVFAYTP